MQREIIMLGTGNAMVTKCFNTCFALRILQEPGRTENSEASGNEGASGQVLLVDAGGGNGIMSQLEKAEISYQEIHHMFLTHGHTDHVLGAVWIVRKIAALMEEEKYEGGFYIYGHAEVLEILDRICRMTLIHKFYRHVRERILLQEVKDGTEVFPCGRKLTAFDIFSGKTKQFGFTLEFRDGKKLTCLGDEPYNKRCAPYVEKTHWLMSEAFCLYEDRERFKPYEKHHSTALDAGRLAQELGVKELILYHTEDQTLGTRKKRYTAEAGKVFSGKIYVPEDLEHIILN